MPKKNSLAKPVRSFRLSYECVRQLKDLAGNMGRSEGDVVEVSIDRMYWEEHAREYFADLKIGLLELNTVPHQFEERLEQFELKRKIVNKLVENVYIHKDRFLEVTIHLNLLQMVQQRSSADQVPMVGTYTRKLSYRGRRHRF